MSYTNSIEKLLEIQDILENKIENIGEIKEIHIKLRRKEHKCPCCGHTTDKVHDYRIQRIKDIDILGKQTVIVCEVYCGRVDILITEDRRMRAKAEKLGIADKVFTINSFITKASNENPALVEYKALSVKKVYFGDVDVNSSFFDTFRAAYKGFNNWFAKKSNDEAYLCRNDKNDILGFLYLKTEFEDENYADITPPFAPKKRLKIGTFKVEASGFRLGERFIKIIFDNAIERKVDEIYVTLFTDRPELLALKDLLERWGFFVHGEKNGQQSNEVVLVKK